MHKIGNWHPKFYHVRMNSGSSPTIKTPKCVKWLQRQIVSLASESLCATHPDVFHPPKLSAGGIKTELKETAGQSLLCKG
jgi:hypothetical protein